MMYRLYMFGFGLAGILPIQAGYFIAKIIVGVYYFFASRDKAIVRKNLKVVLGEDVSEKELERHVWCVFKNFAKYLVDFFKFREYSEQEISENFEVVGREYMDKALEKGKGLILVGLHLGNWELGGALIGAMKYPVCAIALEHSNKRINDFFERRRAVNNLKSIPLGSQVKECFKALKRNEVLGIIGDKDYTGTGTPIKFFGKEALVPKGPAAISIKTGAPIVVTVTTREKDDKFKLHFEPLIEYTPTGDFDADVKELMSKYLKVCEKLIRKYPDQWYVFGEIWDQE